MVRIHPPQLDKLNIARDFRIGVPRPAGFGDGCVTVSVAHLAEKAIHSARSFPCLMPASNFGLSTGARVIVMRSSIPLLALALLPRLVAGQGITTAAIQGAVGAEDGPPIPEATVRVTNLSNGRRWEIATTSAGRFFLEDVTIGGPYRIEARALGFRPEARTGIVLALGQRLVADFVLRPIAIELEPVTVGATADPVLNPSRTGPAEVISAATIAGLPNRSRDFLTLTTLSPEVAISPSSGSAGTGGITIGGQNRLLNSFQVDGGMNHDPYTGRLPGRDILPRPISLDALAEIQVLATPFDVRRGGFAGGLVNAATKSGTNTVHGSVFGFLADAALVGTRADGVEVEDFSTWQYGATIGGPIVRDRAHYFVSVDLQRRVIPDPGPLITDTAGGADMARIGISLTSATRLQDILRSTYGLDPGTLGPVDQRLPARDAFGKISVQLGTNSHLEVSHHYALGERRGFLTAGQRAPGQYWLSSTDRYEPSTTHASRLIWTGLLGRRWSNELIVSYLRLRDACRPTADYPFLSVTADRGILRAGTPNACRTNAVAQDALEVTENLTVDAGGHVVTLGAHRGLLHFTDDLLSNSAGTWTFPSLDSLQAGRATQYDRAFPGPSGATGVDFGARQIGLYVQDRWNPTRALT
ncbi:MAG: carboxypeptidase regulatory-like domain-containing protein, partial [Candidatus Rokuibacteriota bacterium]